MTAEFTIALDQAANDEECTLDGAGGTNKGSHMTGSWHGSGAVCISGMSVLSTQLLGAPGQYPVWLHVRAHTAPMAELSHSKFRVLP